MCLIETIFDPEISRAYTNEQWKYSSTSELVSIGSIYELIHLLYGAEETFVFICLLSPNEITLKDGENLLVVPEISWINLPLPNEVGDDQEQNVETCCLIIAELNQTEQYHIGVMVLEEILQREHLEITSFNKVALRLLVYLLVFVKVFRVMEWKDCGDELLL